MSIAKKNYYIKIHMNYIALDKIDLFYYAKTVKLLKYLLQNPELLEQEAAMEVDYEQ